ncbi:tRNA threonylcarbamoyladenosine dehydratase [Clostridium acetireducens DSM 10703]|jgi:tRNA A37 threonylcarbamoyladenosine dehydratase|uniref:tRNA threonylcarbamoyladenosine dehydratase n=1 Tax=Clostridium acetireducens DSM 10703 TaxID=1121290 RepID=A0A1E8F0T1_9CLOT|nr:tRNA threonylcarbamoyladenosine dehydratase [Clostridium acetireducens]OFI07020.1 tRNA threonylcarbamoyladenosine dehydratase [Clostridium acetireducens DSM 10703]
MEENIFSRTELLIGGEALNKLKNSKVIIFGVGGVGSFAIEALVRAGLGNITIVDNDYISVSNINRQIHANFNTVGKYKVEVMKDRILSINPNCNVEYYKLFADKNNINSLLNKNIDYVIDAIDTVSSKLEIITWCKRNNVKIISSMGTGNKLNPTMFKIADIYETKVCPLAKVVRRELRKRNIECLKVLYSEEEPIKISKIQNESKKIIPGSISFVPPVAGMIIASEVIKDLII